MNKDIKRIEIPCQEKLGWKDIPVGGSLVGGSNSTCLKTGTWRMQHPKVNKDKCTNCMTCWLFCPDMSIVVAKESEKYEMLGFDPAHCKGCGVCSKVCPVKAIEMILGADFENTEKPFLK
jgi:pyruvate ferredoxin oxidoreductase delta subunit